MRRVVSADGLVTPRSHPGSDVGQLSQRDLEEGEIDVPAHPVLLGGTETCEHRNSGDISATKVDQGEAALGRRSLGFPGDRLPTSKTLQGAAIGTLRLPRPGEPEAPDRYAHN